jgi:hypothetical protein
MIQSDICATLPANVCAGTWWRARSRTVIDALRHNWFYLSICRRQISRPPIDALFSANSMVGSSAAAWSELVARPFGSSSVHQVHGLSQKQNDMEMQDFDQQVQTILCCPDQFRHRGDERSDSLRLQASLLLDDCKRGGGLHHSGKSYKRYKAARCLQSTWREVLHREVYQMYLTVCNTGLEDTIAATTLQASWRAKTQRDFQTKTRASTKI